MPAELKPGKLVRWRDREWTILPETDPDLILLKPLGGSDDEITALFQPLEHLDGENIDADFNFPVPTAGDLDDFQTAKMMFHANRLSFRNASGPFRCMGKLSFRPRAYQVVPLVLALKLDPVRMLIADDVGVGKTIEALMILKELIERGEVRRFAVICPPHLCEQWQQELKDKLDIEAEIIRSSTAASLDRKLSGSETAFAQLPAQVISVDYVKTEKRRGLFLNDAPELVIVDEAHSCTRPASAQYASQQQRYHLLHDLARKDNQHLILLTATPHSGKDAEFQSLIGLLNPEFEGWDLQEMDQNKRRRLARHFIQRKRENIKRWLNESTTFPDRISREVAYNLSDPYHDFYVQVLKFARGLARRDGDKRTRRIRSWAALALLRGVMSSPHAGMAMLARRRDILQQKELEALVEDNKNPLLEELHSDSDFSPVDLIDSADLNKTEHSIISDLCKQAESLSGIAKDLKIREALGIIKKWLSQPGDPVQPIIFCKYIATAFYVGEVLRAELPKSVEVQVVTSQYADEQRREIVESMGQFDKRILVATDCLSEGINLQENFNAVLHYDLPWNPNRLEQREGRVDRFGQISTQVHAYLLWGEDNPIDRIVLDILIRKVREIQRSIGVSINIGEDNGTIMEAVLNAVLDDDSLQPGGRQLSIFENDSLRKMELVATNELEQAKLKAQSLRSIFAQESVDPALIEEQLNEVDEAIGDMKSVEEFVVQATEFLGAPMTKVPGGYELPLINLPEHLSHFWPNRSKIPVSFASPTPRGFVYIGRNHRFTEQLCQFIMSLGFDNHPRYSRVARVSVIQTDAVTSKTTLVQFRVRNVIKEVRSSREVIAEELYLWGYEGSSGTGPKLEYPQAKELLLRARSRTGLSIERQLAEFQKEWEVFREMEPHFIKLAEDRAINLVEAHGRFKELVGGRRYEAVYPVMPPDIMGFYILLPQPGGLA